MNPISIALLVLVTAYTPATLHANENTTDAINPEPTETPAAELSSTDQKYGPTKPGETLAQVALQVLTDATIDNEQMMWALYTANPKAFEKSKINRLRTGVFLIVPTLEQARSVDAKIAHREIEKHTARAAPKPPAVKPPKTEVEAQIEEAKREREETAKEQEFLKARLKEMEAKIQTLLRENAERDAKLRAQSTAPK